MKCMTYETYTSEHTTFTWRLLNGHIIYIYIYIYIYKIYNICVQREWGESIYRERERERQKGIREAEREQVGSIVLVMTRV